MKIDIPDLIIQKLAEHEKIISDLIDRLEAFTIRQEMDKEL
jgi:hypothetical protein